MLFPLAIAALGLPAASPAPATQATKAGAAPVVLRRRFTPGETLSYAVRAAYTSEERGGELLTFVPSDVEQAYTFTLAVTKPKADGFVEATYRRPRLVFTIGDTVERGPVAKTIPLNQVVDLTLSPVNEITDVTDRSPKDKKGGALLVARPAPAQAEGVILSVVSEFVQEIQRISFFLGSLQTSLDLAPRLPLEAVRPGDTWKSTVGYSPQKLKGQGAKMATQRLDYTYTYDGLVESRGKTVQRITAKLALKTDLAEFGKQIAEQYGAGDSIITKAPVTLEATIAYDLDPKTLHTLRAVANSKNSFGIYVKGLATPVQEERAEGTTTLRLVSRTIGGKLASNPAGSRDPLTLR